MNKSNIDISTLLNKYDQLYSEKVDYYGNNIGFTKEEEEFILSELNLLYSIQRGFNKSIK